MTIALLALTLADLRDFAAERTPPEIGARALDGALPPAFVAQRALSQLDAGMPLQWCSTFLMVRVADGAIVGGCGFKGAPRDGRVEIGYAVAPSCRLQGLATQAVAELLRLAFLSDDVAEVLAEINPDNLGSTRIAQNLGFEHIGFKTEDDGELVAQWVRRKQRARVAHSA